jgi:hypothetical protein
MSNAEEFAESFVNQPAFQVNASYQNYLVGHMFPHWTLKHKGRYFLRSSWAKVLAVELLGIAPPNPWVMNSGYADAIAVESVAMHEYSLAAGLPAKQLVITGSLTDDVIAQVRRDMPQSRRKLLHQLGLRQDQPILLCAMPPDQKTFDRPGCEYRNFYDLVRVWGECLSKVRGWNLIVRPHPKTEPGTLDMMRELGISISHEETAALVPVCDLYVASVSSTIRWAIACGKPVINYDVYQYGYSDYDGVQGVVPARNRKEFCDLLRELTINPNRRGALATAQEREAERWGLFDGGAGGRLLKLVRGQGAPGSGRFSQGAQH